MSAYMFLHNYILYMIFYKVILIWILRNFNTFHNKDKVFYIIKIRILKKLFCTKKVNYINKKTRFIKSGERTSTARKVQVQTEYYCEGLSTQQRKENMQSVCVYRDLLSFDDDRRDIKL